MPANKNIVQHQILANIRQYPLPKHQYHSKPNKRKVRNLTITTHYTMIDSYIKSSSVHSYMLTET